MPLSSGLFIMFLTMVFIFFVIAFFKWVLSVRETYSKKSGLGPVLIMIITFPIALIALLFYVWGAYETAKGIRNWMHKDN